MTRRPTTSRETSHDKPSAARSERAADNHESTKQMSDNTTTMRDEATKAVEAKRAADAMAAPGTEVATTGRAKRQTRAVAPDVKPASRIEATVTAGDDADFGAAGVMAKQGGMSPQRLVTVPVLNFPVGTEICCQIGEAIHLGKAIPDEVTGRLKQLPVAVVRSVSGGARILVFGEVLQNELEEGYPDCSYVGRWFYIRKHAPNAAKAKKYNTYEIIEIADPRELNAGKADSATNGTA